MAVKFPIGSAILVGGASRRMGADKSEVRLAGMPLIEHVVLRLKPQADSILLVGDEQSDASTTREFCVPDCMPGRLGPLVGVLTALEWYARERQGVKYVFVTSVDVPFLPRDVLKQLVAKREKETEIIFAKSQDQIQYLAGLWPVEMAPSLRFYLEANQGRSIKRFVADKPLRTVIFSAPDVDPFLNVNTAKDLAKAEWLAAKFRGR